MTGVTIPIDSVAFECVYCHRYARYYTIGVMTCKFCGKEYVFETKCELLPEPGYVNVTFEIKEYKR